VHPVRLSDVCSLGHSEKNRDVSPMMRRAVFDKYGLSGARTADYEVDYLITPELGGSDDIQNLWPEPYSAPIWNAYVKDQLEDRLHEMVCAGQIDLTTAQHAIATDWVGAYKQYFRTQQPVITHDNHIARTHYDNGAELAVAMTIGFGQYAVRP